MRALTVIALALGWMTVHLTPATMPLFLLLDGRMLTGGALLGEKAIRHRLQEPTTARETTDNFSGA